MLGILQQGPAILEAASGMPQGQCRARASHDGTARDLVTGASHQIHRITRRLVQGRSMCDESGTLGMWLGRSIAQVC